MRAHKNLLRKVAAVAAVAGLALTGLTACGSNKKASNSGEDGKITLEVWDYLGSGVSNDGMVAAVAEFEKQNPNIKVNRTSFAFADMQKSIIQGGVGGAVPDAAIIDNVDTSNFANLGLLRDISEATSGMKSEFYEGPWESGQLEGKTYALPLNSNNLALFYNKEMLDAAGVSVPTDWESLKSAAKALTTDDHVGLALSAIKNEQGVFQMLPFVWQTGGDLNNYAKSGAEALEYVKGLVDDGSISSSVTNMSQEDARNSFVTEKAAMMINGPWEIANIGEDFPWATAPLPKGKEAATGLGGENLVVMEGAKQPEAAEAFVKFMASKQGAQIYCDTTGQLSSRPDLKGQLSFSDDPNMRVFEEQLKIAHARSYGGEYAKISEAIQLSIQEALNGTKSPQEAAETAEASIKPLLP
ncbi:sugar ABC transporter substrate-binding protein [Actinobaculum suis]|uniref:sugar ABC transporter substrate-binding protein n=1 Tax=Actinobaculum suis TaxID=1657 RepID=UPI00080879D1|nr:sugar ABC transporter substrate-binding protein [Actinobaculum suis]OCA95427.1 sugar ABC transporter substrate-binding protein [Actinobaculum suis]